MSNGPKVAWCEEHGKDTGGTRNCLVCGCMELHRALSRIDYLLGQPNEMEVSDYDVHCDPALVVKRVEALFRPLGEPHIFTKDGHDFAAMVRDLAGDGEDE